MINGKLIDSIDLTPVTEFESKLEEELDKELKESIKEGKFKLGGYNLAYYVEKAREMNKEQLEQLVTYLVIEVISKSRGETKYLFDDKSREELKGMLELWKKAYFSPEMEEFRKMGIGRIENPVTEPYVESDNTDDGGF